MGSDVSESDLEEEETDSESAESEDEDGEEMTPAVDVAILRTLARIRQKDPSIYDSGKSVFDGKLLFWTRLDRGIIDDSQRNRRNLQQKLCPPAEIKKTNQSVLPFYFDCYLCC